MMQEISERVVKIETRLDNHDARLNRHGQQIDDLKLQNSKQDSKLDQLCRESKENTAMTRSIKGGVDTVKWLLAGVSTLGGLWLLVKQLGIF